jgi:hypothetical protein
MHRDAWAWQSFKLRDHAAARRSKTQPCAASKITQSSDEHDFARDLHLKILEFGDFYHF